MKKTIIVLFSGLFFTGCLNLSGDRKEKQNLPDNSSNEVPGGSGIKTVSRIFPEGTVVEGGDLIGVEIHIKLEDEHNPVISVLEELPAGFTVESKNALLAGGINYMLEQIIETDEGFPQLQWVFVPGGNVSSEGISGGTDILVSYTLRVPENAGEYYFGNLYVNGFSNKEDAYNFDKNVYSPVISDSFSQKIEVSENNEGEDDDVTSLDIYIGETNIITGSWGSKGTLTLSSSGAYEGDDHYVYDYVVSEWWDNTGFIIGGGAGYDFRGYEYLEFACSISGPATASIRLLHVNSGVYTDFIPLTGLTEQYQIISIPVNSFTGMALDDVASISFNISGVETGTGTFRIDAIRLTGTREIVEDPDEALDIYKEESVPGDYHYKVDQFGYLTDEPKVAVISQAQQGQFSPDSFTPGTTIEVRTWPDNIAVFSGSPVVWNSGQVDPLNGDIGWWFDFSGVTAPGHYRLYDVDRNLYSHKFRISEDVYRSALVHAMRTYFYQREAMAKEEPYADARWTDGASFLNDQHARYVLEPDNAALERDVSGGWMDAGDSNKYVTFLNYTMHTLLMAYQKKPSVWGDDHNIPESGNGIPDILDEINYEIEWMKKMQDTDGGVFIKAGCTSFYVQSPPSSVTLPRYYGRKASSSTISLAAIFAHAAYVFKDVPGLQTQAAALLPMAQAAWVHYNSNPRTDSADNGEVLAGDADRSYLIQDRYAARAAMWLWAVTGEQQYHDYFIQHYTVMDAMGGSWGPYDVQDQETLLFYTTLPDANSAVSTDIVNSKSGSIGSSYYGFADNRHLYRAYIPAGNFHWGSNQPKADAGTINMNVIDYGLDTANHSNYRRRALEIVHWFHGVNPLGKMMLSNMYDYGAENSVNEFFHTWFENGTEWDNAITETGPAPGYIVGGPNAGYTGGLNPPAGQPPEKSYADTNAGSPNNSWEVSENGIYYQAAYIRLLTYFASDCP